MERINVWPFSVFESDKIQYFNQLYRVKPVERLVKYDDFLGI